MQRLERLVQDMEGSLSLQHPDSSSATLQAEPREAVAGNQLAAEQSSPGGTTQSGFLFRNDSKRSAGEHKSQSDSASSSQLPALTIVVGRGNRSYGTSVLKSVVEAMLQERGIPCSVAPRNAGRLIVVGEDLAAYAEQQRGELRKRTYQQLTRWQYGLVGGGLSVLLSATYLVPLILEHAG